MVINKAEFEEIYQRYYSKVYNYMFYHTLDKNLTEDLVSEVFLKVISKYNSYDSSKALISTWIITISKNALVDYYRKNNSKNSVEWGLEKIQDENEIFSIENEINNTMLKDHFFSILKTMKKNDRTVVFLRYFCDMSYKQIGKHTGYKDNHIGVILNRALLKIKRKYLKSKWSKDDE